MAQQTKRRRSPRDGEATRVALTDAAEQLFAEQGVEGVSIRAINAAAGLAPAAVHYHFGSKEALLETVLDRRGAEVVADISARCDDLLRQPGRPDPADIVRTVVGPYRALLERDRVGGGRWLAIVGQLSLNGTRLPPSAAPATERLQQLIHRAFPDHEAADLDVAWPIAIESVILLMARASSDTLEITDTIVDFAAGGLAHALEMARLRRDRSGG